MRKADLLQGDEAKRMRKARREQAMQRQAQSAKDRHKREENRKISDVLDEGEEKREPFLFD